MASPIKPRCFRCNRTMRNDGTEEQPKWVCQNTKCVRYVPAPKKSTKKSKKTTTTEE